MFRRRSKRSHPKSNGSDGDSVSYHTTGSRSGPHQHPPPLKSCLKQQQPPHNSRLVNSKQKQKKKSVHFSNITIRQYERIIADNPSCSSGAPIGIGWNHSDDYSIHLNDYEQARTSEQRHLRRNTELVLTRQDREELLMEWGATFQEIIDSIRHTIKVKNQRRRTVSALRYDRLEQFMENASRKLKRTVGLRKTPKISTTRKPTIQQQQQQDDSDQELVPSVCTIEVTTEQLPMTTSTRKALQKTPNNYPSVKKYPSSGESHSSSVSNPQDVSEQNLDRAAAPVSLQPQKTVLLDMDCVTKKRMDSDDNQTPETDQGVRFNLHGVDQQSMVSTLEYDEISTTYLQQDDDDNPLRHPRNTTTATYQVEEELQQANHHRPHAAPVYYVYETDWSHHSSAVSGLQTLSECSNNGDGNFDNLVSLSNQQKDQFWELYSAGGIHNYPRIVSKHVPVIITEDDHYDTTGQSLYPRAPPEPTPHQREHWNSAALPAPPNSMRIVSGWE